MLDVAIRGGSVVDGTGRPARRADIGVLGDRIAAMGEVGPAESTIDATGRVVSPALSTSTPTSMPSCFGTPP